MTPIPGVLFADTSFLIGLLDRTDQHHPRAAAAWGVYLARTRRRIVTTEAVLIELLNFCAPPPMRVTAITNYRALHRAPHVEVVPFDDSYADALAFYTTHRDKAWSITDCLSFVIMRPRHLPAAHHRRPLPASGIRSPPP